MQILLYCIIIVYTLLASIEVDLLFGVVAMSMPASSLVFYIPWNEVQIGRLAAFQSQFVTSCLILISIGQRHKQKASTSATKTGIW